jgi:hypothetical protein
MRGDADHLYAAILADPADDTVRLAYADWLDETAGTVTCPSCEGARWKDSRVRGIREQCPCKTGTVPNGNAARAEFIRVQVELANHPGVRLNPDATYGEVAALRRCEQGLWLAHSGGWFSDLPRGFVATLGDPGGASVSTARVVRGFVSEVHLPAAAFLGGECGRCAGEGNIGRPRPGSGPGGQWLGRMCEECDGTGRTEGLAKALFERHPIERVVTDREPYHNAGGCWLWVRVDSPGQPNELAQLPDALFDPLADDADTANRGSWRTYYTHQAALAALNAALVAHGRDLAGLPPRGAA